jgi:hypothetical protein
MATAKVKLSCKGNTLIRCLQITVPAVLMVLLLHPALYAGSNAAANSPAAAATAASRQTGSQQADFLFGRPKGFFGFRIGRLFPRADSELFDMVTRELTLEKSDFQAMGFGIDGGASLHERVDLIFSFDYSKRTVDSEFRDYVDEQDLPITQTTVFKQLPLTGGVKFLLVPRGRQVGRYSYIPSRVVPFVGAGAGYLWYSFEQKGDFVDFDTLEIFPANLRSSGWTPTVYAGGGADINLSKGLFLTMDLRYYWADTRLERDFVGFDEIDLAGLRVSAGLHWHF